MSERNNIIISPDTQRKNRIPPGQKLVDSFPVLHYNGIPKFVADKWTFKIWGLVEKERKLVLMNFSLSPILKFSPTCTVLLAGQNLIIYGKVSVRAKFASW